MFFLHIAAPAIGICDDAVYKEEFDIILKQLDKVTERIENIEDRQGIRHKEDTPEEAIDILEEEMEEFVDILDEVEKKALWINWNLELNYEQDWIGMISKGTTPSLLLESPAEIISTKLLMHCPPIDFD
ncbi:MAG: hypothetical protein OMM_08889 [Candidatus Magnetoglobus multicellularis str. Araruama]|uniref:Uncharacterized protein n=1 Tax=Candidatus Magnetoglobus multicellularis str. Araruama TaxID=890399 RepID=A0A1V1P696_9BACT|nr:MAG: hypothetical protein OMM_08889 [Candidatus Magnetoglobus multicellularis str. Araruama]